VSNRIQRRRLATSRKRRKRERAMSKWTVWVGGSEMSSNLLSHAQALKIVKVWKDFGYDDVIVEEVE
jgi:hypothetical protein